MQKVHPICESDRIDDSTELIIECIVFEGTCPTERKMFGVHYDVQRGFYRNQKRSALQSQSICILGSQKLTALSDAITEKCKFSNEYMPEACGETGLPEKTGQYFTGNFFFIEEQFYVDYRQK